MKRRILNLVLASCVTLPCAFMLTGCEKPVPHEHTFVQEWTYDETHHWHSADCEHIEEKEGYTEHIDENEDDICDVCLHGQVALIGETGYARFEDAISNVANGGTVVLYKDIEMTLGMIIGKELTINLNGKTITAPNNTSNALFQVTNGGKLTIEGDGVINSASQANDYSMAVWARNGGEVVINGGIFTNRGAKDFENDLITPNNNELIYASNTRTDVYSKITINDGTFIGNYENATHSTRYTVNMLDNSKSIISIKGGKFWHFNPSASNSEFPQANFLAYGYKVKEEGNYYCVEEIETSYINVETIDELKAALTNDVVKDVIVLQADLDLKDVNENTSLRIESGIQFIDLNGHKITGVDNGKNSWHAIDVRGENTELTIFDSSEAKTGTIEGRCYGIQVSRGAKLTIDGGNFTCTTNGTYNQSVVVYGGTLIVNGGTFTSKVYETIFGQSWTWDSVAYDNSITINNGEFNYIGEEDLEYGLLYFDGGDQTVTINGGTFNNNDIKYVVSYNSETELINNVGISADLIDAWED